MSRVVFKSTNGASSVLSAAIPIYDNTTLVNNLTNVRNVMYDGNPYLPGSYQNDGKLRVDNNLGDGFPTELARAVSQIDNTLGLYHESSTQIFTRTTNYYNRFKLPMLNEILQKGFSHVFFTRPCCNLLNADGTGLNDLAQSNQFINHAWHESPELVKELVSVGEKNSTHDFMLSLSNRAGSFGTKDEYIGTDTYGKTFTGFRIAYGKNNVESKASGEFTITFSDDRFLRTFQIIKLWVEYISNCYRGKMEPLPGTILNKELDYVSSVYYFVTAEDGETIIFWTKYTGVFPTSIPSNQFSWNKGTLLSNPECSVSFQYSIKSDYNPESLLEFNVNSHVAEHGSIYEPTYDPNLLTGARTWVGAPFVELCKNENGTDSPYVFKLRYRHNSL